MMGKKSGEGDEWIQISLAMHLTGSRYRTESQCPFLNENTRQRKFTVQGD